MRVQGNDLASVPLFSTLSDADREEIAAAMRVDTVPEETFVIERGDLSYKFFVILEGSARVERDGVHLANLGPGDFFGEAGIVRREHRNADVLAVTPLRLGVLIGWDVRDLMFRYPALGARITAAIGERAESE
jgi:CRP-like cAMP-binding protein